LKYKVNTSKKGELVWSPTVSSGPNYERRPKYH
jgi:hypothetical protein